MPSSGGQRPEVDPGRGRARARRARARRADSGVRSARASAARRGARRGARPRGRARRGAARDTCGRLEERALPARAVLEHEPAQVHARDEARRRSRASRRGGGAARARATSAPERARRERRRSAASEAASQRASSGAREARAPLGEPEARRARARPRRAATRTARRRARRASEAYTAKFHARRPRSGNASRFTRWRAPSASAARPRRGGDGEHGQAPGGRRARRDARRGAAVLARGAARRGARRARAMRLRVVRGRGSARAACDADSRTRCGTKRPSGSLSSHACTRSVAASAASRVARTFTRARLSPRALWTCRCRRGRLTSRAASGFLPPMRDRVPAAPRHFSDSPLPGRERGSSAARSRPREAKTLSRRAGRRGFRVSGTAPTGHRRSGRPRPPRSVHVRAPIGS